MKRFINFIILIAVITLSSQSSKSMVPFTDFGFFAGLSTPNDEIANVYNTDQLRGAGVDSVYNLGKSAMDNGYHLGVKLRFGLTDNLRLTGGFAWNRFPQTSQDVIHPETEEVITTINTTTSVIPISAGLNYYLFQNFVGVYLAGDLTYNFINSTVDFETEEGVSVPIQIDQDPANSRLGYSIGGGLDFNLKFAIVGLDVRYNYINLIGTESNEDPKDYLTVGAVIYF